MSYGLKQQRHQLADNELFIIEPLGVGDCRNSPARHRSAWVETGSTPRLKQVCRVRVLSWRLALKSKKTWEWVAWSCSTTWAQLYHRQKIAAAPQIQSPDFHHRNRKYLIAKDQYLKLFSTDKKGNKSWFPRKHQSKRFTTLQRNTAAPTSIERRVRKWPDEESSQW